jgi:hypothetical protein
MPRSPLVDRTPRAWPRLEAAIRLKEFCGYALCVPKQRSTRSPVIDIKVTDGTIVVTPVEMDVSFQELLDGITEENQHPPVEAGTPVGNEAF